MPGKPNPLVHVLGSVRDRDGVGVREVLVRAYGWPFGSREGNATTDTSGAFTMDLPEGEYRVSMETPNGSGFRYVYLERVSITRRSPRIDYRYTGILVQGTVRSPTGAPLDSGAVRFFEEVSGDGAYLHFRNGVFSAFVPRAATYQVTLDSWDPRFPPASPRTIPIAADTTLALQIDAALLTGTIFGPDGAGLEGAAINALTKDYYPIAPAGSGGEYELWVPEGSYRVRVAPPSSARFILPRITPLVTISGPTRLDVSLAGTRWSGFVRSSVDSSVIPSAGVTAAMFADYYLRSAFDLTDGAGKFDLVLEPGKEYDLSVAVPSMELFVVRGMVARADSTFDVYVPGPTP